MRGADALIAALEAAGVDTVFGMPGGANLPLYDALLDSGLRHVLMRHEAGAGHAAEGYARATGRVGVAFATSGPGATNLVTPICDAQMDSIPTLFVTGQVRTALRGTNAFQEADVIGITAPIVKHSIAVERSGDVAQAIADALHLARAGRPGPVLVDVPVDVANGPARADTHQPQLPGYRPRTKPNGKQVLLAARALAVAQRPVLYAGGGVVHAEAAAELAALARVDGRAGHHHADGARRLPGERPAVDRDARDARAAGRQLGDGRGRPDRRRRGAVRRPRDRRPRRVRPAGQGRAHRPRPVRDRQERRRPHPDRGLREARAGRDRGRLRGRPRAARRVVGADPRLERRPVAAQRGRGRARRARRGQGRRDRHHRRRPAPDVGRQPPALRAPAALDHLRRARHDGLRPAGRHRGAGRPAGRDRRVRDQRGLAAAQRAGAGHRRPPADPGQARRARQRVARHGPPAAGHVLGRPAQRGRPRRHARLGRPGRRLRDRGARRGTTTSRTRSPPRSPSPDRPCCACRSSATPTACRCSGPAAPPAR